MFTAGGLEVGDFNAERVDAVSSGVLIRLLPHSWGHSSPSSCQNELTMTTRFLWALGVYAVLALMAAFTLDGNLRLAVWILLAGLTVKTVIAYKAGW